MLNLACSISLDRYFANIHDEHNPSCECVPMKVEIRMAEIEKGGRDHMTVQLTDSR